jgi:hypothetical protein
MTIMKKAVLPLFILLLGATAVPAENWADKMFKNKDNNDSLSHDFGNVASGAQLHHRFTITNIYAVRMEITEIVPGCGCTVAVASKRVLEPRESATIDVTMDATRFVGEKKSVSIKVKVGPEFIDTAVLTVIANARADLVFNPGEVDFGSVTRGEAAEQAIDVDYAGVLNWQVAEVIAKDLPLDVKLEKKETKPGKVGYRVIVTLKKDAPLGTLKEEIYLKTNDPSSPLVPIVVQATVQSAIEIAPNPLNLNSVKTDETLTRSVVVRGSKAFKILGVDGLGTGIALENQLSADEAKVQKLVFKIKPEKAGEFKRELKIRTSLQESPTVLTIEGNAMP